MKGPRFESLSVEKHGGRSIVTVLDRVKGETLKVYRRGTRYLLWSSQDVRVTNKALQRVVREALEGATT